jgi:ADP-ribose pyrophosphatase YjhB (NUDIX family)
LEQKQDADGRARLACPRCRWIHYRNPTVGVAAIILTPQGLLLGRRQSGGWCIPCGHVEWDESIRDAIAREMREELGVSLEIGSVFNAHSNFHDPDQHTVGIWYEAALPDGASPVPGGDLVEVRMFPLDQIPELVFPTDRLIVEQLRQAHSRP